MTNDNATNLASLAALFKAPNAGGGSKYENIKDGLYKGILKAFEKGPTFYDTKNITDEYPEGRPQPKVRWIWDLYTADGTPLNEEITELTSESTGDRSTAGRFFTAHLGRAFDNRIDRLEDVVPLCIGKTVLLSISTKPSGYRKIDVFPSSN